MLDTYQIKRRYTAFDEKSFSRLERTLLTMTTYSLDELTERKLVDNFYDSPEKLLMTNGIVLKKRISKEENFIKISRLHYDKQYFYMDRIREAERKLDIKPSDPFSKHFFFLSNALNSMFTSALQFDTDKLFSKMRTILVIKSEQQNRIMHGYGGLKMNLRYEKVKFENYLTHRKNEAYIVQFELLSKDDTLPLFDEFIQRVNRKFKEIFPTKENKCELALRMTAPLPTKEEMAKRKAELARLKNVENMGLGEIKE